MASGSDFLPRDWQRRTQELLQEQQQRQQQEKELQQEQQRQQQEQQRQQQQQQDRRQPRDRRWARRLLGVQSSDPPATIRKRYHALARRWHPDKVSATTTGGGGGGSSCGGKVGASAAETAKATAMFQQVQAAYEILS